LVLVRLLVKLLRGLLDIREVVGLHGYNGDTRRMHGSLGMHHLRKVVSLHLRVDPVVAMGWDRHRIRLRRHIMRRDLLLVRKLLAIFLIRIFNSFVDCGHHLLTDLDDH